jgi:hypothetical protein
MLCNLCSYAFIFLTDSKYTGLDHFISESIELVLLDALVVRIILVLCLKGLSHHIEVFCGKLGHGKLR